MNAKKCDRCGKFYTNEEKKFRIKDRVPATFDINSINGWNIGTWDLCEQCMKELWHWLCNERETECEEDE